MIPFFLSSVYAEIRLHNALLSISAIILIFKKKHQKRHLIGGALAKRNRVELILHVLPTVYRGVIGGGTRDFRELAQRLQDPIRRNVAKQGAGDAPKAFLALFALGNGFHLG